MERNCGFELSVLIQHIDLKDPHAWNGLSMSQYSFIEQAARVQRHEALSEKLC